MSSISFVVSSIREVERAHHIYNSIKNSFDDFELVYFSPNDPGPNIKWIKEDENLNGGVRGFNIGAYHSQGEYIVYLTDDIVPRGSVSEFFNNIKNVYSNNDKSLIALYPTHYGSDGLSDKSAVVQVNEDLRFLTYNNTNEYCIKPCWGAVSKKVIDNYFDGLLFNAAYKHHYVDGWMGVWLYLNEFHVHKEPSLDLEFYNQITLLSFTGHDAFMHKFVTDHAHKNCAYHLHPKSKFEEISNRYKKYLPSEILDKLESYSIDAEFESPF